MPTPIPSIYFCDSGSHDPTSNDSVLFSIESQLISPLRSYEVKLGTSPTQYTRTITIPDNPDNPIIVQCNNLLSLLLQTNLATEGGNIGGFGHDEPDKGAITLVIANTPTYSLTSVSGLNVFPDWVDDYGFYTDWPRLLHIGSIDTNQLYLRNSIFAANINSRTATTIETSILTKSIIDTSFLRIKDSQISNTTTTNVLTILEKSVFNNLDIQTEHLYLDNILYRNGYISNLGLFQPQNYGSGGLLNSKISTKTLVIEGTNKIYQSYIDTETLYIKGATNFINCSINLKNLSFNQYCLENTSNLCYGANSSSCLENTISQKTATAAAKGLVSAGTARPNLTCTNPGGVNDYTMSLLGLGNSTLATLTGLGINYWGCPTYECFPCLCASNLITYEVDTITGETDNNTHAYHGVMSYFNNDNIGVNYKTYSSGSLVLQQSTLNIENTGEAKFSDIKLTNSKLNANFIATKSVVLFGESLVDIDILKNDSPPGSNPAQVTINYSGTAIMNKYSGQWDVYNYGYFSTQSPNPGLVLNGFSQPVDQALYPVIAEANMDIFNINKTITNNGIIKCNSMNVYQSLTSNSGVINSVSIDIQNTMTTISNNIVSQNITGNTSNTNWSSINDTINATLISGSNFYFVANLGTGLIRTQTLAITEGSITNGIIEDKFTVDANVIYLNNSSVSSYVQMNANQIILSYSQINISTGTISNVRAIEESAVRALSNGICDNSEFLATSYGQGSIKNSSFYNSSNYMGAMDLGANLCNFYDESICKGNSYSCNFYQQSSIENNAASGDNNILFSGAKIISSTFPPTDGTVSQNNLIFNDASSVVQTTVNTKLSNVTTFNNSSFALKSHIYENVQFNNTSFAKNSSFENAIFKNLSSGVYEEVPPRSIKNMFFRDSSSLTINTSDSISIRLITLENNSLFYASRCSLAKNNNSGQIICNNSSMVSGCTFNPITLDLFEFNGNSQIIKTTIGESNNKADITLQFKDSSRVVESNLFAQYITITDNSYINYNTTIDTVLLKIDGGQFHSNSDNKAEYGFIKNTNFRGIVEYTDNVYCENIQNNGVIVSPMIEFRNSTNNGNLESSNYISFSTIPDFSYGIVKTNSIFLSLPGWAGFYAKWYCTSLTTDEITLTVSTSDPPPIFTVLSPTTGIVSIQTSIEDIINCKNYFSLKDGNNNIVQYGGIYCGSCSAQIGVGAVQSILVNDGDYVLEDQPLMTLYSDPVRVFFSTRYPSIENAIMTDRLLPLSSTDLSIKLYNM